MKTILIFSILSIPSIYFSWRSLFSLNSHGFYRFFGWEGIIWLFAVNYPYWFTNPFSINQIFSWLLLIVSAFLAISGSITLMKYGKAARTRDDNTLFHFEKTTGLVKTGVYRFIRHPLYASLIYLSWGILLKNPVPFNILITIITFLFLYLTSRLDEKECIVFFGKDYIEYKKGTHMFLPFII